MKWETHDLRVHAWMEDGGIWIAHCLDLDCFAEAGSYTREMENLAEVAWEAIQHAREQGFDPYGLPAPAEHIRQCLMQLRMHLAATTLKADPGMALADVARQVGYDSESSFGRAFKRSFQESPGAFRRRHRR